MPAEHNRVCCWYPAPITVRGRCAPYRPGERATFAGSLRCAAVRTNAIVDAPVASGRHPVVLYLSSWGGQRGENTAQAQQLASHGYIVIAQDDAERSLPMDFSSSAALIQTRARADDKARRAAARASRVLTGLLSSDSDNPLAALRDGTDRERIGIFGYSFGGAAAAQTARIDPRIRAAVNLDGWMFGDGAMHGVPKPFMIIGTGAPRLAGPRLAPATGDLPTFAAVFDAMNERQIVAGLARHGGYLIGIDGSRHASFCDAALLPMLRGRAAGPIGGRRVHRIIASYLLAFFEHYLRGRNTPPFGTPMPGSEQEAPAAIDSAITPRFWQTPTVRRG